MIIYIKRRDSSTFELNVEPNLPIWDLKNLISTHTKIPPEDQILTFTLNNSDIVLDDEYNLEYYAVFESSCIVLNRVNEHSYSTEIRYQSDLTNTLENIRRHTIDICLKHDPFDSFFELCEKGDCHALARELELNESLITMYSSEGWNAMHYAAFHGNSVLIEFLYDYPIDINQLTRDKKWSALHLSCIQGHGKCTEVLLRHQDIFIDVYTDHAATPLHCACLNGSFENVKLLLAAKANYEIENKDGRLAIELATDGYIKELLHKYMGNITESDILENPIFIPRLLVDRQVWGVLKKTEGKFEIFRNKDDYIFKRHPAIKEYNLRDVREARRCKNNIFHSDQYFYFHIITDKNKKDIYYSKSEGLANLWVRSIFASLLVRKSRTSSIEAKAEILEEFPVTSSDITYFSFEIEKQIGVGSFGVVYLVKEKSTDNSFALKTLAKEKIIKQNVMKYIINEAKLMYKLNSPYIVRLFNSFHTPRTMYMVLEYCPNGSLSSLLQRLNHLPLNFAKIYTAELILAIEYLHNLNVIFRDLKPENILLDANWHIKLADFGLATEISTEKPFSKSFCGSPAYLSPEMLTSHGVGKSADIYGIGCILFELLTGYSPYYSDKLPELIQRIQNAKLKYPYYVDRVAKDLIKKLLNRDPLLRPGFTEIKNHLFFEGIDWESLAIGQLPDFDPSNLENN